MRTIADVIKALGVTPNMEPQYPQMAGNNPKTASRRVQEALGAIEPSQGGRVGEILSGRFQPNFDDATQSMRTAALSALDPTAYRTPQTFADERMKGYMERLAEVQKAESGSYSGGGATGQLIDRLMAENPDMPFSDALFSVQTGFRRGLQRDENGNIVPISGYGEALGLNKYGENYGGETGTLQAQAMLKPRIARDVADQENESRLNFAGPTATASGRGAIVGKDIGETEGLLERAESRLPQLAQVTRKLSDLGQVATYTKTGRLVNAVIRETGNTPRDAAIARAAYISVVDNEILPLLRDTFGAQFTRQEGESLKVTLGDPDKSPEEKDAVLKSFIETKIATIQSAQRYLGMDVMSDEEAQGITEDAIPRDPLAASMDAIRAEQGRIGSNPNQRPDLVVKSPQEAAKLPSGTVFMTPDGRRKVVP